VFLSQRRRLGVAGGLVEQVSQSCGGTRFRFEGTRPPKVRENFAEEHLGISEPALHLQQSRASTQASGEVVVARARQCRSL
jgi:hypothetical protein